MSSNTIDLNTKILILPDATIFRADQRTGGAFQLLNDNEHFLQLQRSMFKSIKHNYSIELWIRPNYYPIIINQTSTQTLSHPVILEILQLPNTDRRIRLECDPTHFIVNGQKMVEYKASQWSQIVLVFGQKDVADSGQSQFFLNGKLVRTGKFLPTIDYNQLGVSSNLIGAETPKRRRSPLITPDDTQNLQWAIFRLYSQSLSQLEVRQNYLAHSHRFGLNRENPQAVTTEHLIAYFDAGLKLSYEMPSVMINNIAMLPPHLFTQTVKIYQDDYIYNRSNRSLMSSATNSELSKLVAQILGRQRQSQSNSSVQTQVAQPVIGLPVQTQHNAPMQTRMSRPSIKSTNLLDRNANVNDPNQRRKVLAYLDQNPNQLMQLINPTSKTKPGMILDWNYIQSTPVVIEILQQFYRNNPDSFVQVMENSNLTPDELNQLYSRMRRTSTRPQLEGFIDVNEEDSEPESNPAEVAEDQLKAFTQFIGDLVKKSQQSSKTRPIAKKQKPTPQRQVTTGASLNENQLPSAQNQINQQILKELQAMRQDMTQMRNQPQINQTQRIQSISSELDKLMGSDLMSNRGQQLSLLELAKAFQKCKSEMGSNPSQPRQLTQQMGHLDSQFRNLKKMCLHAPNVMGYMSHQGQDQGLIGPGGEMSYLKGCHPQKNSSPFQIALRKSQTGSNLLTLPALTQLLKKPEYQNHQIIGQISDSSQRLTQGLIFRNGDNNREYLSLISPVPKLSQLPVLGIVLGSRTQMQKPTHAMQPMQQRSTEISPFQSGSFPPLPSSLVCRQGLSAVLNQGDQNWIDVNVNVSRPSGQTSQNNTQQSSSNAQQSSSNAQQSSSNGQQSSSNVQQNSSNAQQSSNSGQQSMTQNATQTGVNSPSAQPQVVKTLSDPQILGRSEFDFLDGL